MAVPSREAIQRYFDRHVEAWNADDRDGFLANWKSIANGRVDGGPSWVTYPPRLGRGSYSVRGTS